MKYFTTFKVGYSVGVYGCTSEYFILIYTDKDRGIDSLAYEGLYGSQYRIEATMEKKGYKKTYASIPAIGKLPVRDSKYYHSETEAIEKINQL